MYNSDNSGAALEPALNRGTATVHTATGTSKGIRRRLLSSRSDGTERLPNAIDDPEAREYLAMSNPPSVAVEELKAATRDYARS